MAELGPVRAFVLWFPTPHPADEQEPALRAIEAVMPGVHPLRPGLCAVRARGPARYYGGEELAAAHLLAELRRRGLPPAAIGVADGIFAAEQAAYRATPAQPILIVAPGGSPAFLAPLPLETLGDAVGGTEPGLTPLLRRLGAHTLGDFAALAASDVRTRFGEGGARAHTRAAGLDPRGVTARIPPRDFEVSTEFEPPLDRVDQVTFALRQAAERFIANITAAGLVCTAIRVSAYEEAGAVSRRTWAHPRYFTAPEVLDRVRWQLQGSGGVESGMRSPLTRARLAPESVDAISNHEEGLWGQGPSERIHHGLSRIQSMLGHDAVLTASLGGGRLLDERRVLQAWGDAAPAGLRREQPWPGSVPDPPPATVFEPGRAAQLAGPGGEPILLSRRGELSASPTWFAPGSGQRRRRVARWAGPWPLTQRWWDPARAHAASRVQLLDERGEAWLLLLDGENGEHCWLEARYD